MNETMKNIKKAAGTKKPVTLAAVRQNRSSTSSFALPTSSRAKGT
jgi:hypothetical protein